MDPAQDPSSASCEEILVKIKLPGAHKQSRPLSLSLSIYIYTHSRVSVLPLFSFFVLTTEKPCFHTPSGDMLTLRSVFHSRPLLPGTKSIEEIDVDVRPELLKLMSPAYKLVLPFQAPVHEDRGKATWHPGDEELRIVLPLKKTNQVMIVA